MVIHHVELSAIRNYLNLQATFGPNLNLIRGANGQGKTNLAEALYYLCNLDSFRTSRLNHLIRNHQGQGQIRAEIERGQVIHQIRIVLSSAGKQIQLDQNRLRRTSDYVKSFFSLVFTPEDVALFRSTPQDRRKFMDRSISFVEAGYLADLQELQHILVNRNRLLKDRQTSQLSAWNELLFKSAFRIIQTRQRLTGQINQHLSEIFQQLTGRAECLNLVYRSLLLDVENPEQSVQPEAMKVRFQQLSRKYQERELRYGYTLLGPQRDDYRLYLDERLDRDFFSQGELRITNLTLKFVINRLISETLEFRPVLIFDDLFSELDQGVSDKVIDYFSRLPNQIFITSTDFPKRLQDQARLFSIHQGSVIAQE